MANNQLDIDKVYNLVMTCRQSGKSDKQWCIEHDINPSTFYYWVRKLRDYACYDIPENNYYNDKQSPACITTQEVVKVDFNISGSQESAPCNGPMNSTPVVIQYQQANILVQDNFNPNTLKTVLMTLRSHYVRGYYKC